MLHILYQDESLLAVDKPTGLLSVPGRGEDKQDCVIARLLPNAPTARCVHRLDRDTSGVMLVALTAEAQRELGRQFETRTVTKHYEAVVAGRMEPAQGLIDLPLAKDFSAPPRHRVDYICGRTAQTAFQVLSFDVHSNTSRVELSPFTGRSHQLRIHLAHQGHPILGDPLYAPEEIQAASDRLMLHARELVCVHPTSGEPLRLVAACPF
jgi:tRNA pseudouridine32 synthase / 23S rRNA pseudouridine746 synthase